MKRAIITGATGAVGTALINEMINRGIEVLVFCHEGSKRNVQIPEHPLVSKKYCSLRQLPYVENDMGKTYDVFYHFAWDGTVGNARNDMRLQAQNIAYALDAVETAKRFGCHTFVGAGSQAEYGRVEGILKPDTPVFPENGYGIAKLCAGQMTREHAHLKSMKHIWVRILSVYGPNDGSQSMIMSTIAKLKKGEMPQFTKGEQLWDYLFSEDASQAFVKIGEQGIDGKTYVLGSGKAMPLADYIRIICNLFNPYGNIELGAIPYAPQQVMHLQADISELTNDTGWIPKVEFEEGICRTIEWMNNQEIC